MVDAYRCRVYNGMHKTDGRMDHLEPPCSPRPTEHHAVNVKPAVESIADDGSHSRSQVELMNHPAVPHSQHQEIIAVVALEETQVYNIKALIKL